MIKDSSKKLVTQNMRRKNERGSVNPATPSNSVELVEQAKRICQRGRGKESSANALALLRRAADLGNAEAEYAIGTWHLYGKHVRRSSKEAARHFQRAVNAGHSVAMFDLAIQYETGKGVPKNMKRAFGLYLLSALRKNSFAVESVARCVYHGIGTAKNRALGNLLYDYAALASKALPSTQKSIPSKALTRIIRC